MSKRQIYGAFETAGKLVLGLPGDIFKLIGLVFHIPQALNDLARAVGVFWRHLISGKLLYDIGPEIGNAIVGARDFGEAMAQLHRLPAYERGKIVGSIVAGVIAILWGGKGLVALAKDIPAVIREALLAMKALPKAIEEGKNTYYLGRALGVPMQKIVPQVLQDAGATVKAARIRSGAPILSYEAFLAKKAANLRKEQAKFISKARHLVPPEKAELILRRMHERFNVGYIPPEDRAIALRFLRGQGGEAGYIRAAGAPGEPGTLFFGPEVGRSDLIEEIFHYVQDRKAGFMPLSRAEIAAYEIETQLMLLRLGARKRWTEWEMAQIRRNLTIWEEELKKLLAAEHD